MGFVKQSVIYNILSESDGENDKKFKNFIISSELLQIIPKAFAIKYKVLPLKEDTNTVTIATSDPYNIMIINQIADLFNNIKEIITIPYSETEIAEGINKYYESSNNIINIIEELEHDNTNYENVSSNVEDENPIVKLINVICDQINF